MKIKITSRDVKYFILGIFTIILIDILVDLSGAKQALIDGYNTTIRTNNVENIN